MLVRVLIIRNQALLSLLGLAGSTNGPLGKLEQRSDPNDEPAGEK